MIALIGMPGSGKSTIGRQMARRLAGSFLDTDHVIEERQRCSITQIFERQGEACFRELEQHVLDELTHAHAATVLATGGGAVLRPENRLALHGRCQVVYLHALPEDLYRRLRNDKSRPLLQGHDALQRLRDMYAMRDAMYRETAHFVIETRHTSSATLLNIVMMQLELGSDWARGQ